MIDFNAFQDPWPTKPEYKIKHKFHPKEIEMFQFLVEGIFRTNVTEAIMDFWEKFEEFLALYQEFFRKSNFDCSALDDELQKQFIDEIMGEEKVISDTRKLLSDIGWIIASRRTREAVIQRENESAEYLKMKFEKQREQYNNFKKVNLNKFLDLMEKKND